MWGSMLADVFEYMKNNLAEKDYKRVEKYLTAMADLICAGFTPVFTIDENGERTIVDESKELKNFRSKCKNLLFFMI